MTSRSMTRRPLISASTLIGVGMGGFVDGILFHQILQFHNMMSAKVPPRASVQNAEFNMFWDGIFHAFTWTATAVGIAMLWRVGKRNDVPWSTKTFVGSLFLGWGLFNLVEGIVDHHILHIHHVVETPGHLVFDLAFLASGALLMVIGLLAIRSGRNDRGVRGEYESGFARLD